MTGNQPAPEGDYTGVENLEVMEVAVNYRRYLGRLLQAIRPVDTPGQPSALDFGAGVGTYAKAARAAGYDVTCVELDANLQRLLQDEGFTCHSSLEDVADRSYDVVYSYNVLEHVVDDRSVLRELYRVVRPGGRLLLYVPAFMVLFGPMDTLVGHVRRYRRRDLAGRVSAAGFVVQRSCYADSVGFLAALAYRFVGRRSGELNARSVALYDRYLFPVSRILDRLLSPVLGKNVVIVGHRRTGAV